MRRALAGFVAALAAAGAIIAPATANTPAVVEETDRTFDALVTDAQLPLAGIVVIDEGGRIYERVSPGFGTDRPIPVASGSKWIAAALIMTAVDRGELSLDTQVGEWIAEAPPGLRGATLRQLLSHTSGMSGKGMGTMPPVDSLEASVLHLFKNTDIAAPGSGFSYGGASMQVAGLMLERAAGKPFAALFAERIAGPLGMSTAKFGSPRTWGTGEVPWVAGGMAASLDDYRRFLAMILAKGLSGEQRILSAESIAAMETDMVGPIPILARHRALGSAKYGLGVWCDDISADGRCGLVSSAGAFGAYPWIDRRTGRAGVFLTRATMQVLPGAHKLRDKTAAIGR